MGADSHRRFYKGRPQPREVPYTPAPAVPRSHHRNQQRQRQREASAAMPADEVLGLLRQAATAAAGCRALARCGDMDVDPSLLEALVEALVAALHALGPVDDAVARHGCTALVSLCRSSADRQAQVVACGAFAAAAACARAHPQHLPQACAAVEGAACTTCPPGNGRVGLLRLRRACLVALGSFALPDRERERATSASPATASDARVGRLQSRQFHRLGLSRRPCVRVRARQRGASAQSRQAG